MEGAVLHTARLTLRTYERADIPALVHLIGAREVAATTLRIPHPYTQEDAEALFTQIEAGDLVRFAITLQPDRTLIGGTGLRIERAHDRAELGYWIGVPYWGHGYATEAARAVVQYAFDTLGLHRVEATHFSNNPPSGKVLRKLGMKHEGCLRRHLLKWGEYLDCELYAVLKSEWRQ